MIDPIFNEVWTLIHCTFLKIEIGNQIKNGSIVFKSRESLAILIETEKILIEKIVMIACRLDDDSKNNWSFRYAQKNINSTVKDQNRIKQIIKEIKSYRNCIKNLKTIRNKFIAHKFVGEDEPPTFNPFPICKKAIEITDLINGHKMNFTVTYGRYEKHDLRKFIYENIG